jgi:hypothetical protein
MGIGRLRVKENHQGKLWCYPIHYNMRLKCYHKLVNTYILTHTPNPLSKTYMHIFSLQLYSTNAARNIIVVEKNLRVKQQTVGTVPGHVPDSLYCSMIGKYSILFHLLTAWSSDFHAFYKTMRLITSSQELATDSYPEPHESSPHLPNLFPWSIISTTYPILKPGNLS